MLAMSRKEVYNMNDQQELEYYETSTNFINPVMFKDFKWGVMHLEPFTSESGRPPMTSFDYIMMYNIDIGCGNRQGETLNLIKEDFDLKHRILRIWNPKTNKGGFQKT